MSNYCNVSDTRLSSFILGHYNKQKEENKIVEKGPFMEYLRGEIEADNILVDSVEIRTPVSKTEELAMLIHEITIIGESVDFVAGVDAINEWVLSRRSNDGDGASINYTSPDMVYRLDQVATEGIIVGAFSRAWIGDFTKYFNPPLLYAKTEIFFEARQEQAGQAAQLGSFAVGYTLEKVTKESFIDALIA